MLDGKLSFVMLGSNDVDRGVAFYRDVLGLGLSARFENFAFLDAGATTLGLTGQLAPAAADCRSHECVFGVPSVSETYATLKDRIAFLNEPRPVNAGNWAVNFQDPDGHLCSFYGPE